MILSSLGTRVTATEMSAKTQASTHATVQLLHLCRFVLLGCPHLPISIGQCQCHVQHTTANVFSNNGLHTAADTSVLKHECAGIMFVPAECLATSCHRHCVLDAAPAGFLAATQHALPSLYRQLSVQHVQSVQHVLAANYATCMVFPQHLLPSLSKHGFHMACVAKVVQAQKRATAAEHSSTEVCL